MTERIYIHFMSRGGRELVMFIPRHRVDKTVRARRLIGWGPFLACSEEEHRFCS